MQEEFNKELLDFLDSSVTPFHATALMVEMFEQKGFIALDETKLWNLEEGKSYYVVRNESAIIAFTYPKGAKNYLMVGTHNDSPSLKLKPNVVVEGNGVVQLGVEPYGGALLNSWFDRSLSLAGVVYYLNSEGEVLHSTIDFKKPLATIPSLAIHLDSQANKDKTINKQIDLVPILATSTQKKFNFESFLKQKLPQDAQEILSYELSFYDTNKAEYIGIEEDFIASSRLDNLLSCFVGAKFISESSSAKPLLFIANNHEEVGSETTTGAAGSFLENTLKRIFPHYEEFVQVCRSSLLISADNAHAVHPNFASKHEPNHTPHINKGVVLKHNANQRYATSAKTSALFLAAAKKANLPTQNYVVRSDMGCGSTIGPISATRLGIETLDIGLPTLAMHSIRELCGSEDAYNLVKILKHIEL